LFDLILQLKLTCIKRQSELHTRALRNGIVGQDFAKGRTPGLGEGGKRDKDRRLSLSSVDQRPECERIRWGCNGVTGSRGRGPNSPSLNIKSRAEARLEA